MLRSRVVVVKYDRKPLSNKTLFAFTEPFGRLREHLVLNNKRTDWSTEDASVGLYTFTCTREHAPSGGLFSRCLLQAFLELHSHEEALDMVNYYQQHQANLYGKPITFYLSRRLQVIEKNNRGSDRSMDLSMDRPMDRSMDRPMNRPMDRPMDRPMVRSMDRPMVRSMDRSMDRPMDRSMDRAMDRAMDRPMDRQMDPPMDPPMDRPVRQVKGQESQVVFFNNMPRDEEDKKELLTIAARFGEVEKHLFLTDQAFVQLGTPEDAEMLVKYYNVHSLTIKGRPIRLNICTKYKTL
ncbi:hypothetical protein NQZ68_035683, partial [Dissostichus eleginoides]